jgi:hypothetical protein
MSEPLDEQSEKIEKIGNWFSRTFNNSTSSKPSLLLLAAVILLFTFWFCTGSRREQTPTTLELTTNLAVTNDPVPAVPQSPAKEARLSVIYPRIQSGSNIDEAMIVDPAPAIPAMSAMTNSSDLTPIGPLRPMTAITPVAH